jgi:hypothetical protein
MRPIWVMALLLCAGWALHAQTQNVANSATPVKRLLSARTAYLMASGAKTQPSTTSGQFAENLDSKAPALEELSKAMKKWRRFEIVNDVSKADIVMLVLEWEDHHRFGNTIVCRDQLVIFTGGTLPSIQSEPLWRGDAEKWGKWGKCSGAGEPLKELRKEIDALDKGSP